LGFATPLIREYPSQGFGFAFAFPLFLAGSSCQQTADPIAAHKHTTN